MGIHSIRILNYKSIRDSGEIIIKPLNVLIGPNGAGKSNFISFFQLLNKLYEEQLQLYINQKNGGADNALYFGRKISNQMYGKITFNNEYHNEYEFTLVPDIQDNLLFSSEYSNYTKKDSYTNYKNIGTGGNYESNINKHDNYRNSYLKQEFKSFRVFHFHDTGFNSRIKLPSVTTDYAELQEDGGNLAAFLYMLSKGNVVYYNIIEKIIRSIAPFFEKFYLEPDEINSNQIFLRWYEKGSDKLFNAHNLSDGTLRMICLTTLMNQPKPPNTIIIDEPELGLHPFAITKLAAMMKSASSKSQIIISTQSVYLLDQFDAEDVIVVEREDKQSVFRRLDSSSLSSWLDDFSLGEIWDKNIIGGRPS